MYKNGSRWPDPIMETYVDVYSPHGERLARIPVPFGDRETVYMNEGFKIDVRGNLYQIYSSPDGVHIFEWIKSQT